MIDENRYYNYVYMDPTKPGIYPIKGLNIILKHEPFYVGKGSGNRWKHFSKAHDKANGKYLKNKLIKLRNKNLNPIVFFINERINNNDSIENEKYLIKAIGRKNLGLGSLVNLTDGGEGAKNAVVSKETREKLSNIHRGHKYNVGRKQTKEHIESRIKKGAEHYGFGKHRSEETILKIIKNRKPTKYWLNKKLSAEHKIKLGINKRIIVLQFSQTGEFIKEWESAAKAGEILNISSSTITSCCKNRKHFLSAGKFKWKYKLQTND